MSIFTKLGINVAAPFNADGTPRQISPQDFQIWMTEVERLIKGLIAGASGIELPDLIYKYVITGGDKNNIIGQPNATPPDAAGEALFTIEITQANTGNVTINGRPLLTSSGHQIVAGGLVPGIWLFLDDGENFRLVSDQASQAVMDAAELAVLSVEAIASSLTDTISGIVGELIDAAATPVNVYPFEINGNGVERIFPMPVEAGSTANVIVELGGVIQRTENYTVDGASLIFMTAPESGVSGQGRVIAPSRALVSVPNGAVQDISLSAGSKAYVRNRDFVLLTDEVPLSVIDGVTDVSSAIQRLLDTGKKVLVPHSADQINLGTATLDFSAGGSLVGMDGKPARFKSTARTFINATRLDNVTLFENIEVEGANNSTTYQITFSECYRLKFFGFTLFNSNSGFDFVGCEDVVFEDLRVTEHRGSAVKLRDGCNDFVFRSPWFRNGDSFSIYGDIHETAGLMGSSNVRISDIYRTYDPSYLIPGVHDYLIADSDQINGRLGIEAVGARFATNDWQVIGGFIENVDENSISMTGNNSLVQGVRIRNGRNSGIHNYGQYGRVIGCRVSGCAIGIGTSANAGGIGRDVTIQSNHVDSCPDGIRLGAGVYQNWTAGGASTSAYCQYDDGTAIRIYAKIGSGALFGSTPPTHVSGDISDGAIDWRYAASVPSVQSLSTRGHLVNGNRLRGAPINTSALTSAALAACMISNNLET